MKLAKYRESESGTCQSEEKEKLTLVKVKESLKNSHESEINTCERKSTQK